MMRYRLGLDRKGLKWWFPIARCLIKVYKECLKTMRGRRYSMTTAITDPTIFGTGHASRRNSGIHAGGARLTDQDGWESRKQLGALDPCMCQHLLSTAHLSSSWQPGLNLQQRPFETLFEAKCYPAACSGHMCTPTSREQHVPAIPIDLPRREHHGEEWSSPCSRQFTVNSKCQSHAEATPWTYGKSGGSRAIRMLKPWSCGAWYGTRLIF